jgi:hypothetical protein
MVPIDKRENEPGEVVEDATRGDEAGASAPCEEAPCKAASIAVILAVDILKREKFKDCYRRLRDSIIVSE